MRSTCSALLLVSLVVAGCEKKKDNHAPAQPVGSAAKAEDMKPEPVAKEAAAGDTVRAPTAADLAEYTKDVTGNGPLTAAIETSLGTFHCELFADKAPMTVANFVGLASGKKPWLNPNSNAVEKGKPFYDGLTFHRVIPDFMAQGGDLYGSGLGGPGYEFDDEISDLVHGIGTLAYANSGPNTNGSQFYVTEVVTDWLDGDYTIFGQCSPPEVVTQLTHVPADANGKPSTPRIMTRVKITRCAP